MLLESGAGARLGPVETAGFNAVLAPKTGLRALEATAAVTDGTDDVSTAVLLSAAKPLYDTMPLSDG